jgi:hypothetical protein
MEFEIIAITLLYVYGILGSLSFMKNIWKNGIAKNYTLHLTICFIPVLNTLIALTNNYIDYITAKMKRK